MTSTQLRTYPYKRPQIRATLLALLSNDHIRTVSPTTRRLVERNLKAEWCVALSPPPETMHEIDEEAQLAKRMSSIALKGPTCDLRVEEIRPLRSGSLGGQSTLSVNAVADAQLQNHPSPTSSSHRGLRNKPSIAYLSESDVNLVKHDSRDSQRSIPPLPSLAVPHETYHSTRSHEDLHTSPTSYIAMSSTPQEESLASSAPEWRDSSMTTKAYPSSASAQQPSPPQKRSGLLRKRVPPPRPPKSSRSVKGSHSAPHSAPDTPSDWSAEETSVPPPSIGLSGHQHEQQQQQQQPLLHPHRHPDHQQPHYHHPPPPLGPAAPSFTGGGGIRSKFRRAPPPTPARSRRVAEIAAASATE